MQISKTTLEQIIGDLEYALKHTEKKIAESFEDGYPYCYGYLQSTVKYKIDALNAVLKYNEG